MESIEIDVSMLLGEYQARSQADRLFTASARLNAIFSQVAQYLVTHLSCSSIESAESSKTSGVHDELGVVLAGLLQAVQQVGS